MNFKSFTALTLAAATVTATVAPQVKAFDNLYRVGVQHNQLINAVRSTGIQFMVNPPQCFEKDAPMGYYWAAKNEMVICQERATTTWKETTWTAEDLDTLRHEAHHLVQDCMAGRNRDGRLGAVYQNPIGLAKSTLSSRTLNWIVTDGYKNESDHIKVMELEAFAVAAINNPMEQVGDINNFCF